MDKHPRYDLWLHDDVELESHIGSPVLKRTTLHEWPLSLVQKLVLADRRKLIYKTQYGPTVEPEFYASARSRLLPTAETLWQSNSRSCMLMEFIEGPRIEDLALEEDDAVSIGRELIREIAGIEGNPPHYIDISTEEKWMCFVDSTLEDLRDLVDQRRFVLTTEQDVRTLARCARAPAILEAIAIGPGIIHGDLNPGNVFMHGGGYKLIDWQRPILGPSELNLAGFMRDLGVNPLKYVHKGILGIRCILGVNWLTQCKKTWIPDARSYDRLLVKNAERMRRLFC